MWNMIRADLQRIFRGKGIWITLGLYLLINILITISFFGDGPGFSFDVGFYSEGMEYDIIVEDIDTGMLPFYGGNMPAYTTSDMILYFIIPVIVFISVIDFSSGTVKNVLSTGVNRTKYYFSKLILSCSVVATMFILFMLIPTIVITIANGFGDGFAEGTLVMFSGRFLLVLAATSFAIMLSFVTKKAVAMTGAYLGALLAPAMILIILAQINDIFWVWIDYEFLSSFGHLDVHWDSSTAETVRVFIMGAVILVGSIIIGIRSFKKAEIK